MTVKHYGEKISEEVQKVLEIHLFVNPLGLGCLHGEQSLLELDHAIATKVNYQFVPLLTMQTITDTMKLFKKDRHNLALRNKTAKILTQVTMDYEAALFQGRRRARLYLLQLQKALYDAPHCYNLALVKKVAYRSKLDVEMFLEDRQSPLARQSFSRHQQWAGSLGVAQPSTAVVVDTDNPQYSLLIDDFDMHTLIKAYRGHRLDDRLTPQGLAEQLAVFSCLSKNHH